METGFTEVDNPSTYLSINCLPFFDGDHLQVTINCDTALGPYNQNSNSCFFVGKFNSALTLFLSGFSDAEQKTCHKYIMKKWQMGADMIPT